MAVSNTTSSLPMVRSPLDKLAVLNACLLLAAVPVGVG
jgi:hypothetical protein